MAKRGISNNTNTLGANGWSVDDVRVEADDIIVASEPDDRHN